MVVMEGGRSKSETEGYIYIRSRRERERRGERRERCVEERERGRREGEREKTAGAVDWRTGRSWPEERESGRESGRMEEDGAGPGKKKTKRKNRVQRVYFVNPFPKRSVLLKFALKRRRFT